MNYRVQNKFTGIKVWGLEFKVGQEYDILLRTEEFFFSFESDGCSRLGKKHGDFKDGNLTEYQNVLNSGYRGLYFSTHQCISLPALKKIA
jgi:hypothetical protein